jgi:NADH dehydrogenase FAD-containing subunit
MSPQIQAGPRTHALISGAIFGGIERAHRWHSANMGIVLINRQNNHLFPLLKLVATATLSPADIAEPEQLSSRDQTC